MEATVKHHMKSIAIGAALLSAAGLGCGGEDSSGPLGSVDALVILQRPKRNDMGDIFQYTSYIPKARLIKLSPPTADGTKTTICCDQDPTFANVDIQSYDISFDAKQIVFAAQLAADQHYGLYILDLGTGGIRSLNTDPGRDYVSPIFLPGDKVMFTTNSVVEPGAPQHVDEYERGRTIQMGTINVDGSGEELGPRNLSHRTMPSVASDGRIVVTQWDHLGPENSGHLMFMKPDMTDLREAFGKEGTGASNSTLKAVEIAPGRFVAIATSRNRTINAGALIDIRMGIAHKADDGTVRADDHMSEANASYVMLTPDVPTSNEPSAQTVGRYYDAYPLNAKEHPDLLVTWADGPVESSVLDAAGLQANFGVYLYDTARQQRHPILDDPDMWDIFPRPLQPRNAPPVIPSQNDGSLGEAALIGSMNVYQSTLHSFNQGEIFGVRIMEGFSSEEGFPEDFGTSMFEGHADLGVARVESDGSWLAKVPANVPLHLQTVDVFGMSLFNEPVWFSARAGESRVCGGCHEDRAGATVINPGITVAASVGPLNAMSTVPRNSRITKAADIGSPTAPPESIVGVAWDKALQPMFDAKCVSCHDGTPSAANPTYTISDPMNPGMMITWTFDLSGRQVTQDYGMGMTATYSASYFSMVGPDMEAIGENNLMITGTLPCKTVDNNPTVECLEATNARGSYAIRLLNPTKLFPTADTAVRAFPGQSHAQLKGFQELTPTEFYKLILAADMGANYYARENNPHSGNF
jgi:hypothetical protein